MMRIREAGDTIVEVLIAVVVVGTVLFSSYQLVIHNNQVVIDSQEHSLALKVAETQLEYLRADPTFNTTTDQCFSPLTGAVEATGSPVCEYQPNGSGAVKYKIVIGKVSAAAGEPYEVAITWDKLDGTSGSVNVYYRPPGMSLSLHLGARDGLGA